VHRHTIDSPPAMSWSATSAASYASVAPAAASCHRHVRSWNCNSRFTHRITFLTPAPGA